METHFLSISDIILDVDLHSRHEVDENFVEDLCEDLTLNANLPPIEVFLDDEGNYFLVDGFHRCHAYTKSTKDKIEAFIHKGSHRDALLYSVGLNFSHGKRRNNKDKKKVVEKLLKDKEWSQWSDGKIAKICFVSQPFVSKLRREMTQNGFEFPDEVTDVNGRKLKTGKIGKKPGENKDSNGHSPQKKKTSNENESTSNSEDYVKNEEIHSVFSKNIINHVILALNDLIKVLEDLLEKYPDTFHVSQSISKKLLKSKSVYDSAWISFTQSYNLDD